MKTKKEKAVAKATSYRENIITRIKEYEKKIDELQKQINDLKQDDFKYKVGDKVIAKSNLFIFEIKNRLIEHNTKIYEVKCVPMRTFNITTSWHLYAEDAGASIYLEEHKILGKYENNDIYASILFNAFHDLTNKVIK